jgi:NADH dehydrogenase
MRAAERAGVQRLALLSFLRARPDCGSAYHESKWAAEQIVRASGLDWTVLKPGMIYGRGDHMLDHLSRALHTFPVFVRLGSMRSRSHEPRLQTHGHALATGQRPSCAVVGPGTAA